MKATAQHLSSAAQPAATPEPLIGPTQAEWEALSPAERQALVERLVSAASARHDLMGEGRPHARARNAALDRLGQHFARMERHIYIADELPVLYPGEPLFVPDILAVLDVADPGDADERMAWVVQTEGRGLDLVLEILHCGDRAKDLVRNVLDYARLGIAEYFIYDRRNQLLAGHRLPDPDATRYQPIKTRFGRLTSRVLGLDLAVAQGQLRFFSGPSEVPGSMELVDQLGRMVDELQDRAEAEQARAEAEQARVEAEQARVEAEQARAAEQQRHELARLRRTVSLILEQRGLTLPAALRDALAQQTDPELLADWAVRSAVIAAPEQLLGGTDPNRRP